MLSATEEPQSAKRASSPGKLIRGGRRVGKRCKRIDQVIALDLGTRTTKAVWLERQGSEFRLPNYAIQDAPPPEMNYIRATH